MYALKEIYFLYFSYTILYFFRCVCAGGEGRKGNCLYKYVSEIFCSVHFCILYVNTMKKFSFCKRLWDGVLGVVKPDNCQNPYLNVYYMSVF